MKRNDGCHDVGGWVAIAPPSGGLERLRHAMQQSPAEPAAWMMALGGAMTALVLVIAVSWMTEVQHQSRSAQHIVMRAQAYQQASDTLVPLSGDESSPVRVYVAMPIASVDAD